MLGEGAPGGEKANDPESPRRRGPQAAGAPPEDAPAPDDQAARDPRLRGGSEEAEETPKAISAPAARSSSAPRCGKRVKRRQAAKARAARRAAAAVPSPAAEPPLEYKSLELGLAPAPRAGALDRVASVNSARLAATAEAARLVPRRGGPAAAVAGSARLADCGGPGGAGGDCCGERRRAAFPLPLPRARAPSPVRSGQHVDRPTGPSRGRGLAPSGVPACGGGGEEGVAAGARAITLRTARARPARVRRGPGRSPRPRRGRGRSCACRRTGRGR